MAGTVEQGDERVAELAVHAEEAAQDVARRVPQPEAVHAACLSAAGAEIAGESVPAVAARTFLGAERGGSLAAYLADVEGTGTDDERVALLAQPSLDFPGKQAARAAYFEQVDEEEGEEDERRVFVQRNTFCPTEPQQEEQEEDLADGDAGRCQEFGERVHDAAVGVGGQFIGGGDAMGDASKVHAGGLGCLGIHGAVADVEHALLLHAQLPDGVEQSFGVWLGAGDVFAAHHDVQEIRRQVLVQGVVDAEAVFGRDDAYLCAPFLQRPEHAERFGEEAGVRRHVHVGFPAVFGFESRQAVGVGDTRQDGERLFQRLADGASDGLVGHAGITVALQHVAEAKGNAARRVGQGVVEVEEVDLVRHAEGE